MRILLVSPCKDPEIKRPRNIVLPQLALPLIEGLTPPGHEVRIVVEDYERLDLDAGCDLVGISCMTANAARAYALATEFRNRGRLVVIGGVHPTMMPEEALRYADSVVIGEAEDVWEDVVRDASNNNLQRRYHTSMPSLDRYVPIRHRRVKGSAFNLVPIMTTRGCPYNCDFCSVHSVFGRKLRHHPIENVMHAIKDANAHRILFLDDNIAGNRKYAQDLFTQLRPLGIKWFGQASISIADDRELVKLAADSGCIGLLVGLESVSAAERERLSKLTNDSQKLEKAIRTIRDVGIQFHPSFIFGFDHDNKDVFENTLEFLTKNKIGTADFFALTPYPGTEIYRKFEADGRLLTREWTKYDTISAVYRPMNLTAEELQTGLAWTKYQFTKLSAILKRLPQNLAHPLAFGGVALAYRKSFRRHMRAGKYGISFADLRRSRSRTSITSGS